MASLTQGYAWCAVLLTQNTEIKNMGTLNQEIVASRVAKVVRSGKTVSLKKEMQSVYAPSSAHASTRLKNSKNFQSLLNKYLPEELLLKKAHAGLEATRTRFTPEGEEFKEADFATQHKFVETGLKLRGKLKGDGEGGNTTNILQIFEGEQLKRIASRVLDGDAKGAATPHRLPDSDKPKV